MLGQGRKRKYIPRTNAINQKKLGPGADSEDFAQTNVAAKPIPQVAIEINKHPYYQPPPTKSSLSNEQLALNANLLQEQSQLGATGDVAVIATAWREVGDVRLAGSSFGLRFIREKGEKESCFEEQTASFSY
ncbi:Mitogen-activated protein kinase [Bertholletia excelsa]